MMWAPFDLEAALAGAPLVTRSGVVVMSFKLRDPGYGFSSINSYPYIAFLEAHWWCTYTAEGRYFDVGENDLDLFMAAPVGYRRIKLSLTTQSSL